MDDFFEFVEQFLRATNAEGRNEQAALVAEGVLAECLQALAAIFAALVQTIAVGAFEDEDIGAIG